jgi:hypothetical protein
LTKEPSKALKSKRHVLHTGNDIGMFIFLNQFSHIILEKEFASRYISDTVAAAAGAENFYFLRDIGAKQPPVVLHPPYQAAGLKFRIVKPEPIDPLHLDTTSAIKIPSYSVDCTGGGVLKRGGVKKNRPGALLQARFAVLCCAAV